MGKEVKNDPQLNAVENDEEKSQKQEGLSRRMFLAVTGSISATLAATGLLGSRGALGQTSGAPSEEPPVAAKTAAPKTEKSKKYPHLMSPLKIGNHVLKNRMIGTPGGAPHLLVGPEACPNESIMVHHANVARYGASIVVVSQPIGVHKTREQDVFIDRVKHPNLINPDHGIPLGHYTYWDLANTACQNMISQMVEGVHFYGSLCLWKADFWTPPGYDVSAAMETGKGGPMGAVDGVKDIGAGVSTGIWDDEGVLGNKESKGSLSTHQEEKLGAGAVAPSAPLSKELTVEMLQETIDDVVQQAALGKECGFDGIWLHCGYRSPMTARLLSPLTNRRTDKYGGSLENRARFIIEMCDAIKKRCGRDFFIMAIISGEEPEGGYTLDDGAEFAKLFTGHIDLLDLKGDSGSYNAPDNFITGPSRYTPNLYMTEYYKKKGVTIPLLSDGGFTDLDLAEDAIASGKTDAVGMCRIFITNPGLIQLAREGRNEDVVPCVRCNLCHGPNYFSPWTSVCAVNPLWGLEHKIDRMVSPPTHKKKVAVIGGGPAGMKAALIAAERGHTVTLYEKTGALGGTFKTIENVSFKWPNKDFKDYLVRQIGKSGVEVRLNTEADAAMIKKEGYDAVLAAVGAEPVVPDIPGISGKNVMFFTDVFGNEKNIEKDVVIVGGGERGAETAMHLAEKGHQVTVLEESKTLAPEAVRIHYYQGFMEFWQKLPNCKAIMQARCNGIMKDGVTYIDADGKQQSIKAGSVVVAMGMKPKSDLAITFSETSEWFDMAGTCHRAVDLQTTIRSAFGTASVL